MEKITLAAAIEEAIVAIDRRMADPDNDWIDAALIERVRKQIEERRRQRRPARRVPGRARR